MRKLMSICLAVTLLALGGCSSTGEGAKADKQESNSSSSASSSRKGDCVGGTGSRLGSRCS